MQQDIEIQLWEYIDCTCDATAGEHIKHMIATDEQWKKMYDKLVQLNASMPAFDDLEQPSMRFTKNVMEAIVQTTIAPPVKRYINPLVIRVIAGFFITSIVVLVAYAMTIAEPGTGRTEQISNAVENMLNPSVFRILIWINVVVGLLLLDTLLRRKKAM